MTTTYAQRFRQLVEQRAYERRIQMLGLAALLAPYSVKRPPAARMPWQREAA